MVAWISEDLLAIGSWDFALGYIFVCMLVILVHFWDAERLPKFGLKLILDQGHV